MDQWKVMASGKFGNALVEKRGKDFRGLDLVCLKKVINQTK